jgi:hypothetical protein
MNQATYKQSRLDLSDKLKVSEWCATLNCSEAVLRYCVMHVGKSVNSVEAFLQMNRDWLNYRFQ